MVGFNISGASHCHVFNPPATVGATNADNPKSATLAQIGAVGSVETIYIYGEEGLEGLRFLFDCFCWSTYKYIW